MIESLPRPKGWSEYSAPGRARRARSVFDYGEDYLIDRGLPEAHLDMIAKDGRMVREPVPLFGTPLAMLEGRLVPQVAGGAGFASYDEIVASLTTNALGQRPQFQKTTLTTVAAGLYDGFNQAGIPAAGTFGTALTGRTRDNTIQGAIPFASATGGRTMHLLSLGLGSTVSVGTFMLYDRLAEYPFNGTTTSATWTTQPALPARDVNGATSGDGVFMFLQNFSATATAAVTFTPTYTDSAGNAGNTSAMAIIASGTSGHRIPHPAASGLLYPLAAGDVGVRSVQSYTLSATATSTQMQLVLVRPIAWLPMLAANSWVERDFVLQLANLPRLYDGTCLGLAYIANTTTSPFYGQAVFSEN